MLEKTEIKGPEVRSSVTQLLHGPLFFLLESLPLIYWPRFLRDHGESPRITSVALERTAAEKSRSPPWLAFPDSNLQGDGNVASQTP